MTISWSTWTEWSSSRRRSPLGEPRSALGSAPQRYPLIGDGPDDFRGIVYVSAALDRIDDLRAGKTALEEVAAPPLTVLAGVNVSGVIDRFQDEHQEQALVVSDGEDGEVGGLVTATDAMEAVVGELEDPLDEASDRPRSGPTAGRGPIADPTD